MPSTVAAAVATCVAMFGVNFDYGSRYYIGVSDGTEAGTKLLYNTKSEQPMYFTQAGKNVVFRLNSVKFGDEIWVTDGTSNGTRILKDIYRGADFSSYPGSSLEGNVFATAGKFALFSADSYKYGDEMWVTDGSVAGTVLLRDSNLGKENGINNLAGGEEFIVSNGRKTFFVARDTFLGSTLWSTDGTAGGTMLAMPNDNSISDQDFRGFLRDRLIYSSNFQTRLWSTSGSEDSVVLLKDFDEYTAIGNMAHVSSKSYFLFSAYTSESGREPWVSDGTPAGTKMLKNVMLYDSGSHPSFFFDAPGYVLFPADSDGRGFELWVTQGTAETTKLLKDINSGSNGTSFEPFAFAVLGKKVVFSASVLEGGSYIDRLFITDGTPKGTKRLSSTARPYGGLVSIGNAVLYRDTGGELWRTRGEYNDQRRVSSLFKKSATHRIEYMRTVNIYKRGGKSRPCPQ